MPSTSPWRLRSSGTRPSPARIAARGDDRRTGLPPTSTRPVDLRIEAEQRLRDLGSPGADQAGQADHLAGADLERDVAELARARQLLDAQQLVAGRRRHVLGDVLVEAAADHQVHQRRLVERAGRLGRDVGAVAQHRHRVAEPEDLRHAVRDVDAGDAALAQAPHERVQPVGLVLRQAAGRLVEDDHARAAADRGGDLHHLLLAERQLADRAMHVDAVGRRHRRPHRRSRPASRARAAPSRARRRRSRRAGRRPRHRFSATVRFSHAASSWCTMPMPARSAAPGLRSSTCRPSTITSPASGA